MNNNIILGWRIEDGRVTAKVTLLWDNKNGAIIVGRSGSGKSHFLAHMLTQYALKGVKIAVAEYNAENGAEGQTLLERLEHVQGSYIRKPATSGDEIIDMITWLKQELVHRQNGNDKYPLVVVFDEFFQFAASVKPEKKTRIKKEGNRNDEDGEMLSVQSMPTFWNDLLSTLVDVRKNNIRIFIAGQELSGKASSNMMRSIREAFRIRIVMNASATNAEFLGVTDTKAQRIIENFPTGRMYISGRYIHAPYPINPTWIDASYRLLGNSTNYVSIAREIIPAQVKPIYTSIDKRYTYTRVLAHLLSVDFSTLQEKGKYNIRNNLLWSKGVYEITNTKNNYRYVGMTEANFISRWRWHVKDLLNNKNNYYMQKDYNGNNLTLQFNILEILETDILARESYWIHKRESEGYSLYNIKR